MKLKVFDGGIGTKFACNASNNYMNFLYSFNEPIIDALGRKTKLIKKEMLNDIKYIETFVEYDERDNCFNRINYFYYNLNDDISNFLNCFDCIEIIIKDTKILDNIDMIIRNIDLPIVLNFSWLSEEYILNNIKKIDSSLKEKNKVSYIIKECLDDEEAHYEDNSYSSDDVLLVLTTIRNLTSLIKQYNLSPLEQVMYAYDIVKDRYYIRKEEEDSYLESRDLARVLKSDKIVCLGFATLFKSLLDNLGIDNKIVLLQPVNGSVGHARNLISIKDLKYNLNHILYFDATWDSKKSEVGIKDENKYDNFAREKLYYTKKDYGKFNDIFTLPYYLRKDKDYSFLNNNVLSNLIEIQRIFRIIDWKKYFDSIEISGEILEKVNCLMGGNIGQFYKFYNDYEFCRFMYIECCKMLNRELDDDTFLRCLYTVRRLENYLNPNKYNFSREEMLDIYYQYFMSNNLNEIIFLREFVGIDKILKDKMSNFEREDIIDSRNILLNRLKNLSSNINELEIDNDITVKEAVKIIKNN